MSLVKRQRDREGNFPQKAARGGFLRGCPRVDGVNPEADGHIGDHMADEGSYEDHGKIVHSLREYFVIGS